MLAQILMVTDPARPGPRDAFVAALGGRLVVTNAFLTGKSRQGATIRYERALRLKRYLCAPPACEVNFASDLQVTRQM